MNATSKRKRIALANGGGDCPGLNAVIRAVVKSATLKYGYEVWGCEDGFDGFLGTKRLYPMTSKTVQGILPRGGTILGTSNRGNPFRYPERTEDGEVEFHDYSDKVMDRFREKGFDCLLLVGGDGTLTIGNEFMKRGIPVIGIPKTIDNDLQCTEYTFGFDTALHTATEAIDKLHTTAESHDRVMLVEVMGRNAGWIALHAGIAGGADVILIPEIPFRIEDVCDKIRARARSGNLFSIIVVAEGAAPLGGGQVFSRRPVDDAYPRLGGVSSIVAAEIEERMEVETRVVVLGHLQRGGSPSPFDRLLGTRFGFSAVSLAAKEQYGRMVVLRCGRIESVPLEEAITRQRLVDVNSDLVLAARAMNIEFGD